MTDAPKADDRSGNLGVFIGLATGFVGIAGTLAALGFFQFLSAAFISAGLMPLALLFSPWRRSDSLRTVYGVALSVGLIITGVYFHYEARPPGTTTAVSPVPSGTVNPSPTMTASARPTPTVASPDFRFKQSDNAAVPYCVTLSGTGSVPENSRLWIFEHQVGATGSIYLDEQAVTTATTWTAANLSIGASADDGERYEISAVLLPADLSNWLDQFDLSNMPMSILPPGATTVADITVVRRGSHATCP